MIRIEPIDYPQLYAQAVSALREGERYWFTPEEEVLLNRNNRMFEKRPLLEELFLHYFRIPEEEEVCEPLSAPEILMTISKQSKISYIDRTSYRYSYRFIECNTKHFTCFDRSSGLRR